VSAGHPHHTHNKLAHARELDKLLREGGAPELMRRWSRFDFDHDIVYLAGYNVFGTTRYADRDFVRALFDPAYAEHLLGAAIDTGLSPDHTLECVLWHESIEKVLIDADNPINDYADAHEFASAGEDRLVIAKGGNPLRYNRGLERIIRYCQAKPLKVVPADYDCAPVLDDQTPESRRILKELQWLGVADSFKLSKEAAAYRKSTTVNHCAGCKHWQAARTVDLHARPARSSTVSSGMIAGATGTKRRGFEMAQGHCTARGQPTRA